MGKSLSMYLYDLIIHMVTDRMIKRQQMIHPLANPPTQRMVSNAIEGDAILGLFPISFKYRCICF